MMPFIQQQIPVFSYQPVDENRYKNACPKITISNIFMHHTKFKKQYELFYEDTYGLRDLFIRCKNQIDYTIFNKADKFYIGKKGWFFSKRIIDKEVKFERLGPEELNIRFQRTKDLADYLLKKNITLVIITTPEKNTIYPEFTPYTMPNRPDITFLDKYRQFLDGQKNIIHIDGVKLLKNYKKEIRVFHKTDFHWNHVGMMNVIENLISTLETLEGIKDERRKDRIKYTITTTERIGAEINNLLPMFSMPIETDIKLKSLNNQWKKTGRFIYKRGDFYSKITSMEDYYIDIFVSDQQQGIQLLPPTVLYADSFLGAINSYGVHTYFSKFYRAIKRNDVLLGDLLKNLPSDCKYFILERQEVDILDLFDKHFFLPDDV